MAHPLESPREKVKRANKHIQDLEGLIRDFFNSKPYEVFTEEDMQAGRKRYRIRIRQEPPGSWGPVIGDILFNLRSALDHLACRLVAADGGSCTEQTYFPIGKDLHAFKSMLPGSVKGAGKKTVKVLRAHKPYAGGNDLLWLLHQLNRVEKHRFPLVAFATQRSLTITMSAMPFVGTGGVKSVIELPPVAMFLADRGKPLEDGEELGSEPIDSSEYSQVNIEIAFGEPGVAKGEPLLDTLYQMASAVEGVINSFSPLFP